MLGVPERLTSITHPLVSSIYLKKKYGGTRALEDVLVIETNFSQGECSNENHSDCMTDLLADLHKLQIQAEKKIGHFDRVDIRTS